MHDLIAPNRYAGAGMFHSPLGPRRHSDPSVFLPENLLREARRQRGLAEAQVPAVCLLDPDGDLTRELRDSGRSRRFADWACYHTELDVVDIAPGVEAGIVGRAVGAPFAVLVAEQLFASGCRLIVSMTSAGRISGDRPPPHFVLLDRAWRDEGTSHHYLPSEPFVDADPALADAADGVLRARGIDILRGATWTTDAPYRETEAAIAAAAAYGILTVEMEAAALYAMARARGRRVLCLAHVTNQMAQNDGDFEKGEQDGTAEVLAIVNALAELA